MDWRYLDLRRPQNLLIFEVQTTLEHAMREFWLKNDFIEVHSPKITGSPSESGAELFQLDYFDRKAYLAQFLNSINKWPWRPVSNGFLRWVLFFERILPSPPAI
jgi:hypothetical protein